MKWVLSCCGSQVGRFLRSVRGRGGHSLVKLSGVLPALAMGFALAIGASPARAEAPVWPTGVANIMPVNDVMTAVTGILTFLAGPFVLFSIGLVAFFLIWRMGKRFVGGHA